MRAWRIPLVAGILLLALIAPRGLRGQGDPLRVSIVASRDLPPYAAAAEGFLAALRAGGLSPEVDRYTLGESDVDTVARRLRAAPPALILTLGTEASRDLGRAGIPAPTLFALVLDPAASQLPGVGQAGGGLLTGVSMDLPPDAYLEAIASALPGRARVGLLAGPATQAEGPALMAAATARGMTLTLEPIAAEREVSRALSALTGKVDVLLAYPDPVAYTQGSTRYVLLQTLRQGVPLVGPSEGFVEGGALMGLGLNYADLGAQAGAMALQILGGAAPGSLPVQSPRAVRLLLNQRTARLIGVRLGPDALRDGEVLVP